jgi:hypothetical protein
MDPLSQSWATQLWMRQTHRFAENQFAYNAGRCRTHAVMTACLQRWRYSAQGVHVVTALLDQVNAFPSVDWRDLDSATSDGAAECDQELLTQRYRSAIETRTANSAPLKLDVEIDKEIVPQRNATC